MSRLQCGPWNSRSLEARELVKRVLVPCVPQGRKCRDCGTTVVPADPLPHFCTPNQPPERSITAMCMESPARFK